MGRKNLVVEAEETIRAYLKETGMKPSRLGLLACANQHAVSRILDGGGSVPALKAILDYIDKHPAKDKR